MPKCSRARMDETGWALGWCSYPVTSPIYLLPHPTGRSKAGERVFCPLLKERSSSCFLLSGRMSASQGSPNPHTRKLMVCTSAPCSSLLQSSCAGCCCFCSCVHGQPNALGTCSQSLQDCNQFYCFTYILPVI